MGGEKYMGDWECGVRQGKGCVVTSDGIYYQGAFLGGKLTGPGLMVGFLKSIFSLPACHRCSRTEPITGGSLRLQESFVGRVCWWQGGGDTREHSRETIQTR